MQVISFGLEKISVEKKAQFSNEDKIQNNIKIKDIESSNLKIGDEERPALTVYFEFIVNYSNAGKLELNGFLICHDNNAELIKKHINEWKVEKKTNPEFHASIYNHIIRRASVKALELEEMVGLPLHMTFPIISAKPTNQENQS
ncbi:hypothetical protein J4216_03755 [Candidatus Woesearchaeota archaeon]|nr:hypothetical protein [Candidatus Woesearchaeota archaeon]